MEFESVLMTFNEKSDEQIAIESLLKANEYAKLLNEGQSATEDSLKQLMKQYLDVFWVFQDLRQHMAYNIHVIGKMLHKYFSCKVEYDKEEKLYFSSCPAILLHYDFGFSLRALEKYKCSICGKPIIDCDHMTGDFYDNVECRIENGICNICGRKDCKEHILGNHYDHVQAAQIPYDVELITFDIVHDPEMKFARVTKAFYSYDMIKENMISKDDARDFVYGESDLYCNHCLQCKGYDPEVFASFFKFARDNKNKE